MLKKLQHSTTAMVQSMKRSKGGPNCINPDMDAAIAHYEELQRILKLFIEDANKIIACVRPVVKYAAEFSSLTEKTYDTLPTEDRPLSERLADLVSDLNGFLIEPPFGAVDETVIQRLKAMLGKVDALTPMYNDHHSTFLILESNQSKLDALQREPEKNAKEIQSYTEKIDSRTIDVNNLESQFIDKMSEIWDVRFQALGVPLSELLEIITAFGRVVIKGVEPIAQVLGPEALAQEYRAQEPAPPKK
jgi:hypothetical protein